MIEYMFLQTSGKRSKFPISSFPPPNFHTQWMKQICNKAGSWADYLHSRLFSSLCTWEGRGSDLSLPFPSSLPKQSQNPLQQLTGKVAISPGPFHLPRLSFSTKSRSAGVFLLWGPRHVSAWSLEHSLGPALRLRRKPGVFTSGPRLHAWVHVIGHLYVLFHQRWKSSREMSAKISLFVLW